MTKVSVCRPYPFKYRGSKFFLVLSLLCWFPLGVTLLLKNTCSIRDGSLFYFRYRGSWFWLFFWMIVFFPLGLLLLFFNGVDVIEETVSETIIIIDAQ